jgi:4-diphosphocytidyl-2-C-methyl-D-erythritol kinase
MKTVSVFAPAKINLALHVTGQRADGYHLLDSLVAFADVGDDLIIQEGNTLSLTTEGPEASSVPPDMQNLVMQVAGLFDDLAGASFLLEKKLPVSSGIGGGSADAAAAFRGLLLFLDKADDLASIDDATLKPVAEQLLALGADLPMCLLSAQARVSGIGEIVSPIRNLPQLDAVLVNPRRAVSTPTVFKAMQRRDNPPLPDLPLALEGSDDFIAWLAELRNDLEDAAIRIEPSITAVKSALESDAACRLARMSGSGATCFGLYGSAAAAKKAAKSLSEMHPDWWVKATRLGTQTHLALPRLRTAVQPHNRPDRSAST